MRDTIATLFRAVAGTRTAPRAAVAAMLLAMACGLGGCAGGAAASGAAWIFYVRFRKPSVATTIREELNLLPLAPRVG